METDASLPSAKLPSAVGLFTDCRTPHGFAERAVDAEVLRRLYDLVKWGPTSGNCQPARFVFLTTQAERERIKPALSAGNIARAMAAPVLVLCAYDPLFFDYLPRLSPVRGVREWFAADMGLSEETAFRNATLQGGYFILAARALGLACLPMSGFDAPVVEDLFLRTEGWRMNFIAALGYPVPETFDVEGDQVRAPRLDFEDACRCL